MSKEKITFDQLKAFVDSVEITVGEVIQFETIKKSSNWKLTVSFAEDGSDNRTVVTNITDRSLMNKKFFFYTNLEPTVIKKITSEAMFVAFLNEGNLEIENYSIGSKLSL